MTFPDETHELCAFILFILTLSSTLLNSISLATPRWIYSQSRDVEYGLFESCVTSSNLDNCEALQNVQHSLNATRAFMIMGSLLMVIAIPLTGMRACGKLRRSDKVTGALLFATWLMLLIACSVFTATHTELQLESSQFGYSFWMAWASCIIAFIILPLSLLSKDQTIA